VTSGNRSVSVAAFTLLGSLWAVAAGEAHEDGTEAMYLAPVFAAEAVGDAQQCGNRVRFERIQLTSHGRPVDFEWNPRSGELSFSLRTATAGVTLPERFVSAASVPAAPSCE
jgi:hypothetical protein